MPSIGIVVPAYDPNVDVLLAYLEDLRATLSPARVHVELDAASDATVDAVRDAGATVGLAAERRGKGAAVTAGFEELDTDVYAFADADGSTTAASFAEVVDAVADGGADLAVGSRRHPDATVESHQTVARRFLGDGFAWLAGQLLAVDLYDYQCGAKAISAAGWERVRDHLCESGFARPPGRGSPDYVGGPARLDSVAGADAGLAARVAGACAPPREAPARQHAPRSDSGAPRGSRDARGPRHQP
jgi:glycosyltransferase involved in cell wall biosynthesis